jgi:hypothetical protein
MPGADKSTAFPLAVLSNVLYCIAALLFFFGGRILREFWGVDRWWAEFLCIALALLLGILAASVDTTRKRISKGKTEGDPS